MTRIITRGASQAQPFPPPTPCIASWPACVKFSVHRIPRDFPGGRTENCEDSTSSLVHSGQLKAGSSVAQTLFAPVCWPITGKVHLLKNVRQRFRNHGTIRVRTRRLSMNAALGGDPDAYVADRPDATSDGAVPRATSPEPFFHGKCIDRRHAAKYMAP